MQGRGCRLPRIVGQSFRIHTPDYPLQCLVVGQARFTQRPWAIDRFEQTPDRLASAGDVLGLEYLDDPCDSTEHVFRTARIGAVDGAHLRVVPQQRGERDRDGNAMRQAVLRRQDIRQGMRRRRLADVDRFAAQMRRPAHPRPSFGSWAPHSGPEMLYRQPGGFRGVCVRSCRGADRPNRFDRLTEGVEAAGRRYAGGQTMSERWIDDSMSRRQVWVCEGILLAIDVDDGEMGRLAARAV